MNEQNLPGNSADTSGKIPVCVDVDGSLLRTDLLFESISQLGRTQPFRLFQLPLWLMSGRAAFKHQISRHAELDLEELPFNEEVVQFAESMHQAGRPVYLVTAAAEKYADGLCRTLPWCSGFYSSSPGANLKGRRKRDKLIALFGENGFDYVGNSRADRPAWSAARKKYLVSSHKNSRQEGSMSFERVFRAPGWSSREWLQLLRPAHWVKNLLLFLPLILAHQFLDVSSILQGVIGFFAFSFCASSIYIINDFFDLAHDRKHPSKQNRPVTSGLLPVPVACATAAFLLAASAILAVLVSWPFAAIIGAYFAISVVYCLWFKQVILLDVFILAGLYTLRIFAGSVATDAFVSNWLLEFSIFFFLNLALLKRYIEIASAAGDAGKKDRVRGRGYSSGDLVLTQVMGLASGYISVLIFVLYLGSEKIALLYERPEIMWLASPLLLYWISRLWILAGKGRVASDPVVFALKDRVSYIVLGLTAVVFLLSL